MSSLFKTPKTVTPDVEPMPTADETAVQRAKKTAVMRRSQSSGRSSTMLSQYGQADRLGG